MNKLKYAIPLAVALIFAAPMAAQAGTGTHHSPPTGSHGTIIAPVVPVQVIPVGNGYCLPTQIYFEAKSLTSFAARVHPDAKIETCKLTVASYQAPDTWDHHGFDLSALPQSRFRYTTVVVTKEPTFFSAAKVTCGNGQNDVVGAEQPATLTGPSPAHLFFGKLYSVETPCQAATPPSHNVVATCRGGLSVNLSGYPKDSIVQITVNGAALIQKFTGNFNQTVPFKKTENTNWKVQVTTPDGAGDYVNSGTVKACVFIVHPKPPIVCSQGQVISNGKCVTPTPPAEVVTKCDTDNKTATTSDDCLAFTGATPLTKIASVSGVGLLGLGALALMFGHGGKKEDQLI